MRLVLHPRSLYFLGGGILAIVFLVFLFQLIFSSGTERVTTTVSRGEVAEIVPVSGVAESNSTSHLTFKVSDVVETIVVTEGDEVQKGDVLATLKQDDLQAERKDAVAALEIARADRDELITGPSTEERDVTNSLVASAEANLERTILEQDKRVENARRALYSTNLEAVAVDTGNDNVPPTISGTYTCTESGEYRINMLSTGGTGSRHEYRLLGIEVGTYDGYEDVPTPMGACGLTIQFDANSDYEGDDWIVEIPNTRGSSYVTNYNAYQLALETRDNEVQAAEENLDQVLKEQTLENATPRNEALRRANAAVLQAEARLEVIDARIAERTLIAPFAGTITSVEIVEGETPDGVAITLIGDGIFELTARIPEIDIAKIAVAQRAHVVFDARAEEILDATVTFISPIATEIDGVAYFEAKLELDTAPEWIRAGLNADIDIVTRSEADTLRLPKRFLTETDTGYVVYLPRGRNVREQSIGVTLLGNDGYAAITGLNEGDIVVSP